MINKTLCGRAVEVRAFSAVRGIDRAINRSRVMCQFVSNAAVSVLGRTREKHPFRLLLYFQLELTMFI
jgi:hypothetical protein